GASVAGYCSRIPEAGRTGMTDIIDLELFDCNGCDSDKLYQWWKQQPPELQPVIMEAMIEASLEYDYDFYLPYYRQKYGEKYRELMHRLKGELKGPIRAYHPESCPRAAGRGRRKPHARRSDRATRVRASPRQRTGGHAPRSAG